MDPISTLVSTTGVNKEDLMGALYSHFRNVSLYWSVVENGGVPIESGVNPGDAGFLITPKGSDAFQVNFRYSSGEVFVSLDPQPPLTITDPTNPSATASSEWSGETTTSVGQINFNDNQKNVWLIEYPDAFTLIVIGADDETMSSACHVGRVYTPFFPSYVDDYVDGLAVLGRLPLTTDGAGSYYWMSTSTTTLSASLWRTGETTWVSGTTTHKWVADVTTVAALGRTEPVPVLCFRDPDTYFGTMKYVFSMYPEEVPWSILSPDSSKSYLHVGDSPATVKGLAVAWDPLVTAPRSNLTVPVAESILDVQILASFDHIYDFESTGTPTNDKGTATAANLTEVGTWTNAAPTVTGTQGSYSNNGPIGSTRLETAASAVNVARTADIFYEGIWEFPVAPSGAATLAMAMVGTYNTVQTHSFLVYKPSGNRVELWNSTFGVLASATGLTSTYLNTPTYIAVWWDHANTVFRLYYKKSGQTETVLSSGVQSAGTAGNQQLWISGNSVNISTAQMKVHMFGIKRGALTAAHRQNIYDQMGI